MRKLFTVGLLCLFTSVSVYALEMEARVVAVDKLVTDTALLIKVTSVITMSNGRKDQFVATFTTSTFSSASVTKAVEGRMASLDRYFTLKDTVNNTPTKAIDEIITAQKDINTVDRVLDMKIIYKK